MLTEVKTVVSEQQAEVSAEIKSLINREADLANRGRPVEALKGLRNRITKLFLTYMENENINPEVGLVRMRKMAHSEKFLAVQRTAERTT